MSWTARAMGLVLVILCLFMVAAAGIGAGESEEPSTPAITAASPVTAFVRTLGAMIIVVALLYAMSTALKLLGRTYGQGRPGSRIKIIETARIGTNAHIHIIDVCGHRMLIGSSERYVGLISENSAALTDQETPVQAMTAVSRPQFTRAIDLIKAREALISCMLRIARKARQLVSEPRRESALLGHINRLRDLVKPGLDRGDISFLFQLEAEQERLSRREEHVAGGAAAS